jgi:Mce-associated membrane protein
MTRRIILAGWLTVAVAAGFAAWAGTQYASAASSPAPQAGQARDAALNAGTREVADLNTVSAHSVTAWEQRWLDDTTGAEHAKIQQTNPAAAAQIQKVKTSSVATVTDAAITALDPRATSARMIATVSVVQTNASGASDTVANRYLATLTLTAAGWKISSLSGG